MLMFLNAKTMVHFKNFNVKDQTVGVLIQLASKLQQRKLKVKPIAKINQFDNSFIIRSLSTFIKLIQLKLKLTIIRLLVIIKIKNL